MCLHQLVIGAVQMSYGGGGGGDDDDMHVCLSVHLCISKYARPNFIIFSVRVTDDHGLVLLLQFVLKRDVKL